MRGERKALSREPHRPNQRITAAALRALVLDACRRSIAAGRIPTAIRLRGEIPGYSEVTLTVHRKALADAGLIDWSHLEAEPRGALPCRTEADLAVIRERARLVRLGIDPDTGRRLPPPVPCDGPFNHPSRTCDMNRPTAGVLDRHVLERARHYCYELLMLTKPRGRLAALASGPDVDSAARRLLEAVERLEGELERELEGEDRH